MRGDDSPSWHQDTSVNGRPPRARGRRLSDKQPLAGNRKTPACAGTTTRGRCAACSPREDPRVRGDDPLVHGRLEPLTGRPPRARGRHRWRGVRVGLGGKTPACAGTTSRTAPRRSATPEDPRVRGDDIVARDLITPDQGRPPRARGRLRHDELRSLSSGKTPACAGTTRYGSGHRTQTGEDPRVRGDDLLVPVLENAIAGRPPRARGRHTRCALGAGGRGKTPACAGTTLVD